MSSTASTHLNVKAILAILAQHSETLCVAESLTGGALGAAITEIPGASQVFVGGTIAYSKESKSAILGVDAQDLASYGVVSEEIAQAMANGARKVFGATWGIATTGVAGPGSADGVPAGTVWIAISGPINHCALLEIEGDREVVRNATVTSAIAAFERILSTR